MLTPEGVLEGLDSLQEEFRRLMLERWEEDISSNSFLGHSLHPLFLEFTYWVLETPGFNTFLADWYISPPAVEYFSSILALFFKAGIVSALGGTLPRLGVE